MDVPKQSYESVLLEGQKFALEEELQHVSWVNHYDEASRCGYLQLAYAILDPRQGDYLWCLEECLPKDILEYLRMMQSALKTRIAQSYNRSDNALCIQPKSFAYDEQLELLNEFIKKQGIGPFSKIMPMTRTGELLKEEKFPIKIKK